MKLTFGLILVGGLTAALPARGELELSALFGDHMVFQRGAALPIWGTAKAGTQVAIEFAGRTRTVTADTHGNWIARLDSLPADPNPRELAVTAGKESLRRRDILVGDVWLCAGGLETARRIASLPDAATVTADKTGAPLLRVFTVEVNTARELQNDLKGRWQTADAPTALPAQACFLGRSLAADLGVPVGIIVAAVGYPGQPIESWMDRQALGVLPAAKPILEYYASDEWKKRTEGAYEERLKAWMELCQRLPLNPPPKPQPNDAKTLPAQEPGAVWNAMVAPLARLAIRGVVWDHGEDEGSRQRATQYGQLLPGLIASWRQAFEKPALPFVLVQLRPRHDAVPHGSDGRLAAELRDAQRSATVAAGVPLVVTIDLGNNPHPRAVCPRIAEVILAKVYRMEGIATDGPEPAGVETAGNKVMIRFRNAQGGLVAKGGKPQGFAIASSLFRWVWADAQIQGDTIVVSAPTVDKPQGVRYAYQDLPEQGANLYNAAGCPAAPFRTDDHLTCTGGVVKPGARLVYNPRVDLGIENPRLPRILIIGDSISGHYLDGVRQRMRDRANVIGESSMQKNTWASMGPRFYRADWAARGDELQKFLAERGPFAIVHFNNGIHNFARAQPGDEVPYAEQLRKVVATIRRSGAVCLFANSTGTLGDNRIPTAPHYLTNCRAFNAAAEAVMRDLGVPVTDLHGLLQPRIAEFIGADLIHTTPVADAMMADAIAVRLNETLDKLRAR